MDCLIAEEVQSIIWSVVFGIVFIIIAWKIFD